MRKYKNHIPITDSMYKALLAHKKRTGMGAIVIHAYMKREGFLPTNHKVTVKRIESWFTRIAKMTIAEDFEAVLKAYQSISDKEIKKSNARCGELRIPLTQEFIDQLNAVLKDRPNFSRNVFLKYANPPKGFSPAKFSSILTGKVKTIAISHKEFLKKAFLERT